MTTDTSKWIDIVFDGPPSHESGRFIEVEDDKGRGFGFGEWVQRGDGYWVLRIPNYEAALREVLAKGDTSWGSREIIENALEGGSRARGKGSEAEGWSQNRIPSDTDVSDATVSPAPDVTPASEPATPDHPLCKAWMGACGLEVWKDGLCKGHHGDVLHNPPTGGKGNEDVC